MKHNKALGVALVTALVGNLLVGCTSDNATTKASTTPAATTTPAANPLVGTWFAEGDAGFKACGEPFRGQLVLTADGRWVIPFCDDGGTYEVNGGTITWLGGDDCDADVKGDYTYTLENGQFIQTAKDDRCGPRKEAFDGVTYDAPIRTVSPSES